MDFLVEATLQLNTLLDKIKVRDILRSQGFVTEDLTRDQVRVKGSFLKLKSVKASLEMLLKGPATVGVIPSPSTVPKVSSGDISRHHTDVAAAKRGQLDSKHKRASPSASTISSSLLPGSSLVDSSGTGDKPGSVCFTFEHDLYYYVNCFQKKDVDTILVTHDVKLRVKPVNDTSVVITLLGKGANAGMNKLKTLLENLFQHLTTQDVPLKDLTPEGMRLVAKIQEYRHVYKSVLMQKRHGNLHLIGPSRECYDLKQRLLGRTADPSQQRGRITERKPTRRSLSLPPTSRRTEEGAGAEGYAPSKYQDDAGRSR